MNRYFRLFLFGVCAVQLVFAIGFSFLLPFATRLWPLSYTNSMTYIFVGSIFAAGVASTVWCLLAREYGALAGVALDYMTIFIPTAIFTFQISRGGPLRTFSLVAAAAAVFGLGMFLWSVRIPIRDRRPMPRPVRWGFVIFIIALLIVGGSMVLKLPNVLPWDLNLSGQVLYGWMFLGAAAYFTYALLRPSWHNSAGQLAGFLAYDVVLILPFLRLFAEVNPDKLPNLIIYTAVVVLSGILAAYYLFVNPATRIWRMVQTSPQLS